MLQGQAGAVAHKLLPQHQLKLSTKQTEPQSVMKFIITDNSLRIADNCAADYCTFNTERERTRIGPNKCGDSELYGWYYKL